MCMMSACINREKEAAPVLMAMGKRIEGLWSGYYTGLGCLGDDHMLRFQKTTGWSKYWEQQYSLQSLPGKMGFFHSRTGSGGDRRYAHPFLSHDEYCLMVSQGCSGIFSGENDRIAKIGNRLLDNGAVFSSADFEIPIRKYIFLNDGSQVHVSDIVCEYAAFLNRQGMEPLEIVRRTGTDVLEESISLFIFKNHPGHIYISNMNQRMFIVFDDEGVRMATCALAMGEQRMSGIELPCNTVADVSIDGIRMERMSDKIHPYLAIPPNLETAFLDWMKDHPKTLLAYVVDGGLNKLFPDGIIRRVPIIEIFEKLYYDGRLALETEEDRPGPDEFHKSVLSWVIQTSKN